MPEPLVSEIHADGCLGKASFWAKGGLPFAAMSWLPHTLWYVSFSIFEINVKCDFEIPVHSTAQNMLLVLPAGPAALVHTLTSRVFSQTPMIDLSLFCVLVKACDICSVDLGNHELCTLLKRGQ